MLTENNNILHRQVFICQGKSCTYAGAKYVLKAFQKNPIPHVEIIPCGCLRQCGNGPMVIIQPENSWYWRVHPDEVSLLKDQHLIKNCPVISMLYSKH